MPTRILKVNHDVCIYLRTQLLREHKESRVSTFDAGEGLLGIACQEQKEGVLQGYVNIEDQLVTQTRRSARSRTTDHSQRDNYTWRKVYADDNNMSIYGFLASEMPMTIE